MDEDFGRRVKAARGYAGDMSQRELAEELKTSTSTVKRLEADPTSVKGDQAEWAYLIANVTGVPEWFLTDGWNGSMEAVVLTLPQSVDGLSQMERLVRGVGRLPPDAELGYYFDLAEEVVHIGQAGQKIEGAVELSRDQALRLGRLTYDEAIRAVHAVAAQAEARDAQTRGADAAGHRAPPEEDESP